MSVGIKTEQIIAVYSLLFPSPDVNLSRMKEIKLLWARLSEKYSFSNQIVVRHSRMPNSIVGDFIQLRICQNAPSVISLLTKNNFSE